MRKDCAWKLATVGMLLSLAGCVSLRPEHVVQRDRAAPAADAEALRVCLAIAETAEKAGEVAEAIRLYEKTRHVEPARIAHRLALLYERSEQFDKAKAEFERALKLAPEDADVLADLGRSLMNQGHLVDAEKHLRLALRHNGKHGQAWLALGLTLDKQGKPAEAKVAFQTVLASEPGQPEAQEALGRIDVAARSRIPVFPPVNAAAGPQLPPQTLVEMDDRR